MAAEERGRISGEPFALYPGVGLFTVRPMRNSCMEKSGVRAVNPGPFISRGFGPL
jgi:hypothetical protein